MLHCNLLPASGVWCDCGRLLMLLLLLQRRLASILTQAFDDCATLYGRFKLLDSFDDLLERPIIQDEMERKQIALVQQYGADLKRVQVCGCVCVELGFGVVVPVCL